MAEESQEFADALSFSRKGRRVCQSFDERLLRAMLVAASPPAGAQLKNNGRALDWKIL